MTVYRYVAYDALGARRKGKLEAPSREGADSVLRKQGLRPQQLDPVHPSIWTREISLGTGRATEEQVVITCRQLATLVGAGVGVSDSLRTLAEQAPRGLLKQALTEVDAAVRGGRPLAEAMGAHPTVFPVVLVNLVKAGEVTGDLDSALEQAALILEKQRVVAAKVRSAMIYPVVVLTFALALSIFMLVAVIPKFVQTFEELHAVLPWPTRAVMTASEFIQTWWWLLAAVVMLAVAGRSYYARTPHGRMALDRRKLRLPIFGPLVQKTAIARLARCLGSMLTSAVPVLDALSVTAEVVGNAAVGQVLMEARESLRAGGSISAALKNSPLFPPVVVQMVRVGEQSGAVDTMLLKVAEFYEADVDLAVSRLQPMLEPILIGIVAVVVGVLILAGILPSFSLASQI